MVNVELEMAPAERRQLAGILGIDEAQLDEGLGAYGTAALIEYTRMFLGQKVFTRGSDIREYRLFLLTREAFGNRIPDEQKVSDLFQTTATQSRSLIRSVMSKYQYELQGAINESLREVMSAATQDEDDWILTAHSENLIEALNRLIGAIDASLPQIEKRRGTAANYVLKESSYRRLRERLGLDGP